MTHLNHKHPPLCMNAYTVLPQCILEIALPVLIQHSHNIGTRPSSNIGGGAIFLVGGSSSGETKIAEGIRDAKNCRFVLCIAFAGKSGGLQPPPPQLCRP